MRADAVIQLRVSECTKREWREHAQKHGVRLSDFIRLACRLSTVIGHDRLAAGLAEIAAARRDLHALTVELRAAGQSRVECADDVRAALTRINLATDSISSVIRGRAT